MEYHEAIKDDADLYLLTRENTQKVQLSEKANYSEVRRIHFYK